MVDKFTFFWKNRSPFTNWYPSKFTFLDVDFCCGEQYMMYVKAIMFDDFEIAKKIMATSKPSEHLAFGRQVKNYDDVTWSQFRYDYMVYGLYEKFKQNPELKEILLNTGSTIIAEASPTDLVWGIGLEETDPLAQDRANWKGQNLLGKVLMEVRFMLYEADSILINLELPGQ
jgi:ribA/ribD-fused uncharacterized protein